LFSSSSPLAYTRVFLPSNRVTVSPKSTVEFPDGPIVERPILPEFDNWVAGLCYMLFWSVKTGVQSLPDLLQVLYRISHKKSDFLKKYLQLSVNI
jgi:hypothetical protein